MLRKIGFRYADRVDPFDGAPHFVADTDQVSLGQAIRPLQLSAASPTDSTPMLVGAELPYPPYFKAIAAQEDVTGDGQLRREGRVERLGGQAGSRVWAMPLGLSIGASLVRTHPGRRKDPNNPAIFLDARTRVSTFRPPRRSCVTLIPGRVAFTGRRAHCEF